MFLLQNILVRIRLEFQNSNQSNTNYFQTKSRQIIQSAAFPNLCTFQNSSYERRSTFEFRALRTTVRGVRERTIFENLAKKRRKKRCNNTKYNVHERDRAFDIMQMRPSYVDFFECEKDGALWSMGGLPSLVEWRHGLSSPVSLSSPFPCWWSVQKRAGRFENWNIKTITNHLTQLEPNYGALWITGCSVILDYFFNHYLFI